MTILYDVTDIDGEPVVCCRFCGRWFETADGPECEDCEPSDCAFCGVTTIRPLLSDRLACALCDGDEVA